jgi:hypothetical protein
MECQANLCTRDCMAKEIEYAIVSTGELPQHDAMITDCGDVKWINWMREMVGRDEEIEENVGSATDTITVSNSMSNVRQGLRASN